MINALKEIWNALANSEKRQQRKLLIAAVVLNLLDLAFIGLTLWFIKILIGENGGPSLGTGINRFVQTHAVLLAVVMLTLFGLKNFVAYEVSGKLYRVNYNVACRLAADHLNSALSSDYLSFVETDSAAHIYKVSQQPVEFSQYLLSSLQQIVIQTTLIGLTLLAVAFYNPLVLLLLFLFIIPPLILSSALIKKKISMIRNNNKVMSEKSIQHLKESLAAFVESYIFNARQFFSIRYLTYQQKLNASLANLQTIQILPGRLFEVFAIASVFMVIIFDRSVSSSAHAVVISVGAFMAATYKIIPGLLKIITAKSQISAYRYILHPEQKAAYQPDHLTGQYKKLQSLTFNGISFQYRNKVVIRELFAELNQGDFVGLQGVSGKGKTTLVNLFLGFFEPLEGTILINSAVADQSERMTYRTAISYVKQQNLIIHDSILKNITLTDRNIDQARLINAIRISGVDKLAAHYAEGLQKIVAENGENLSGGQRQRIMLARALYKKFDLLILDEPFSELDEASEYQILEQLTQLANEGKMILLITHNHKSMRFCNKIINLNATKSHSYT